MGRVIEITVLSIFIVICGLAGAMLSKHARDAGSTWPYFLSGLFTVLSWVWVVKRSPYNLVVSAIYWDVLYNAAWIGCTILMLKEASSQWQAIGAVIVIVGLAMMGL